MERFIRLSPKAGKRLLQYSCLENPMDRGDWQATVHEVARVRHNLVTKPPTYLIKDLFPEYIKNSEN